MAIDYLFSFFPNNNSFVLFLCIGVPPGSPDATGSALGSDFAIRNLGARGVSTERVLFHWAVGGRFAVAAVTISMQLEPSKAQRRMITSPKYSRVVARVLVLRRVISRRELSI